MSARLKAVVDTNVLVASIGSRSPYRWLFDALLEDRYTLCVSTPILLEYEQILARKTTPSIARSVLNVIGILPNVEHYEPSFRWRLIKADPADDKFVDCVVAANAHLLITHDHHFSLIKQLTFPSINVLTADEARPVLLS